MWHLAHHVVPAMCRSRAVAGIPSSATGPPRDYEPPSYRRAEPTTPADRVGAPVDYFPTRAAFLGSIWARREISDFNKAAL
jgi:hypothetical protein